MAPTEKQLLRVEKIKNHFGPAEVETYIKRFYKSFSFETMTKDQAQKIITGLAHMLPRAPIYGIRYSCWKG